MCYPSGRLPFPRPFQFLAQGALRSAIAIALCSGLACTASRPPSPAETAGGAADLRQAIGSSSMQEAIAAVRRLQNPADLERVAWESRWKDARFEAISLLADPETLARLARQGDWFLRQTALARATDPALLAEAARSDEEPFIREGAARRLTDDSVLLEIARTDPDLGVRETAVRRLTRPEALAGIALGDPDPDLRLAAASTLRDPQTLTRVAQETTDPAVREQAVKGIMEPGILASLAGADSPPEVRILAVRLTADAEVVRRTAFDPVAPVPVRAVAASRLPQEDALRLLDAPGQSETVRRAAAGTLREQGLLRRLVLEDPDPVVRRTAIASLEDAALLSRLAQHDADEGVRARATSRLSDQALLERIARHDAFPAVRREAVARLKSSEALPWALQDPEEGVRAQAVQSLSGPADAFTRAALEDPSSLVRKYAVGRLLDPPLLDRVLRNDPSAGVREAALRRQTDPARLAAYLGDGPDRRLRVLTASMMRDPAVLALAAATEPDEEVREAIWRRLDEMDRLDAIADEVLRERVRRFNQEPLPSPDPRETRLKAALAHPLIAERLGPLEFRIQRGKMERRYVREREGGGYPPLRGRVVVEKLTVQVIAPDGRLLAERSSRGDKPGKGQAFDDRLPLDRGVRVLHHHARVDITGICSEVLKGLSPQDLRALATAGDHYLSAAAEALLNP